MIKRAESLAEQSREHGIYLVHKVDRGASQLCLLVKFCALLHEVRHIGYVHTDLID